jgi:cold shock CspA family protein
VTQGTIKEFDDQALAGSLLMDDRTEVGIDRASLEGSGLRTLRLGQRVRFRLEDQEGRQVARELRIVTFD